MKISNYDLIKYLEKQNQWVDGINIAHYFAVSLKTIFNYIKRINDYQPELILSSNKGYALNKFIEYDKNSLFFNDSNQNRINYLIKQLLISKNQEVDIYIVADNLFISDSYVEMLLKQVKEILNKSQLDLFRKRNKIRIVGDELNIRRFVISVICKEKADDGVVTNTYHGKDIDIAQLQNNLIDIFTEYNIKTDDYCFNTIVLYFAISITRIKNNYVINEKTPEFHSSKNPKFFDKIKLYVESTYNIKITPSEYYYLATVVSKNSYIFDKEIITDEVIHKLVDKKLIVSIDKAIVLLVKNYQIKKIDEDMRRKLIVHIQQLYHRLYSNFTLHYPLSQQVKNNNLLFFDMAAYFIHEIFENDMNNIISDDEICFLAFHLADYLDEENEKLNCCFIYTDYYQYYQKMLNHISTHYSDKITLSKIARVRDYYNYEQNDLIITNYPPVTKTTIPYLLFDDIQIINNTYEQILYEKVNYLLLKRKCDKYRYSLTRFFSGDLFDKNCSFSTKEDALKHMCLNLQEKEYCSANMYNKIIEREQISSLVFNNSVALPHSFTYKSKKSFIYPLINDKPLKWNEQKVNLIVFIGAKESEIDDLKTILNDLVSFLCIQTNVQNILTVSNYTEFYNILAENDAIK
ncbi:MAG: PTS sugar transporter subunit IIA [Erysipelotrichia bacterium]|nr:PTS sugar transporter subunit IIA [Erysipelotrichia bacterium]